MRKIVFITLLSFALFILGFTLVELKTATPVAATDGQFRARASLALCPDYTYGGVTVELKYRGQNETGYHDLSLLTQSINPFAQLATFDFNLPSTFGNSPIYVAAFCRNSYGLGPASNEKLITNCDALAIRDSDSDGLTDGQEDTNCNGFYDVADASDSYNYDTDGDGIRDLIEVLSGKSPKNAGNSPRPMIVAGAPFDPDGNGNSNAVVWRPASGTWYIKDFTAVNNPLSFDFGRSGDIPFVYNPRLTTSDVGVIRQQNNSYTWLFHGPGFELANGSHITTLQFGSTTDWIIPGPWEEPVTTNPAVARLSSNGFWMFEIYLRSGTARQVMWGLRGDIPRVQDYDGDGIFDVAVFRASTKETYIIRSSDGGVEVHTFGSASAEYTLRGDYSGDGVADIVFWEPNWTLFTMLKSDFGFSDSGGLAKHPLYYQELNLGTYFADVPLSWNKQGDRNVFTVINHEYGIRKSKAGNSPVAPIDSVQWGLPGDFQG